MDIENPYERVKPDDPRRCQGTTSLGQCNLIKYRGDYCIMHGQSGIKKAEEKQKIRNYRLQQYQERIGEFADSEKLKDLREEIGILRLTLESIVTRCTSDYDILLNSGKISGIVLNIEKIVLSCHKLESSTGDLLDKVSALSFAQEIITIISSHIDDSDKLNGISEDIVSALGRKYGKPEDN